MLSATAMPAFAATDPAILESKVARGMEHYGRCAGAEPKRLRETGSPSVYSFAPRFLSRQAGRCAIDEFWMITNLRGTANCGDRQARIPRPQGRRFSRHEPSNVPTIQRRRHGGDDQLMLRQRRARIVGLLPTGDSGQSWPSRHPGPSGWTLARRAIRGEPGPATRRRHLSVSVSKRSRSTNQTAALR